MKGPGIATLIDHEFRNCVTVRMMSQTDCIVLVTGGSGFVGQHVVGLLQTRAPHVSEIRIIDLNPYENKLDYKSTKPVKQYIGSITDRGLVRRACQDVSSVIHVASLIDISVFPDPERLERVNIQGTSVLLDVCRETGVQRFIYCSSMSTIFGYDDIVDGTESNTHVPEKLITPEYGMSKLRAEALVLNSNSEGLRTISIRPSSIFGEEDEIFITANLKIANKLGRWILWDCGGAKHQMAYVGNVAWMFICAETAMLEDVDNNLGGNIFFVADDTHCGDPYELRDPFLKACNFSRNSFKPPLWLLIYLLYAAFFILFILSPLWKINFPYGIGAIKLMLVSFNFKYDKAKAMLNYRPLYTYDESFTRSIVFYKRFSKM